MTFAQRWLRISLLNFILAALVGLLLRFAFVVEIPWMHYTQALHAHSHMAMLGWGYLAVFAILYYLYQSSYRHLRSTFNILFLLLEISALGMFVCFPIFGYGIPTVSFLSAHMVFSYVVVYYLWRYLPEGRKYLDTYWVKAALFFLLLSTIGVWVIAPIFAFGLGKTIWYYLAVQFFLHFEINAWFLFAAMTIFFTYILKRGVELPQKPMKWAFYLFFISSILTYALAVAWSNKDWWVTVTNTTGVILQAGGAILLLYLLWPQRKRIIDIHPGISRFLLWVVLGAFCAKILIQLLLVLPAFMEVAYTIRNMIVGFIHLILLGIFTSYVFAFFRADEIFTFNKTANVGIGAFIIGFLLTELILFIQGGMFWMTWGFLPYYYWLIAISTILLPMGLVLLFTGLKNGDQNLPLS